MHQMRGYRRTVQLELFRPPPQGPTWEQIPPDVQPKIIILLAKMLREHRTPICAETREAPHE